MATVSSGYRFQKFYLPFSYAALKLYIYATVWSTLNSAFGVLGSYKVLIDRK